MNNIEYRRITERDIPSLLDLYDGLYRDNKATDKAELPKAKEIWKEISEQNIIYFGAFDGEKVISTCYIAIIPNLTHFATPIGFIENVVTEKACQRRGIGKKVMEAAIEYGKSKNCHKLVLMSGQTRKEAHKFYEALGFDGDSKRGFEIRLI